MFEELYDTWMCGNPECPEFSLVVYLHIDSDEDPFCVMCHFPLLNIAEDDDGID